MFEKLIREIEDLDGSQVSLPISLDDDGLLDRQCPDESCLTHFKVESSRWDALAKDARVTCPSCGHKADREQWHTLEQVAAAKEYAGRLVKAKLERSLHEGARDFNARQPKGGFISLSASVSGSSPPIPERRSISALPRLPQVLICPSCATRFATAREAIACPLCGGPISGATAGN